MYFAVTDVTPQNNYLLRLKFQDGEECSFAKSPDFAGQCFKSPT